MLKTKSKKEEERFTAKNKKRVILKIGIFGMITFLICLCITFSLNFYVKGTTKNQILDENSITSIEDIDAILVLGAGIWGDKPSHMLEDRLLEAIALYEQGVAPKIIMSGDHGRKEYDEVNIMKDFAIQKGIPSEDIFMDHAGFSSYDSMFRAREIFEVEKIVVVTQEYHLYRALYIANKLGIEAYGLPSNPREYAGQTKRELREILARNKDFFKCILKPNPTYLGDAIPISGSGDLTNDY